LTLRKQLIITTQEVDVPFFVQVHVPKTGGTTISSVLRKIFGEEYDPFEGRWIHHYPRLTSAQVKAYAEKHNGILATSSHNFTLDLPFADCERPVYAFTCVRNPVDRFFHFTFICDIVMGL
jgi:Sulfotransferase family